MQVTMDDVQLAKDEVIRSLTNELLRARAELAALRRQGAEHDGDDPDTPSDG